MAQSTDNKDITATGPVGLRGLKGINNFRQESDYSSIYNRASRHNPHAERLLNLLSKTPQDYTDYTGFYEPQEAPEAQGLGESVYDSPVLFNPSQDKIQNIRAEEQSGLLQMANGLGKGILTIGTTFVDGTLGLLWGLGEMAATGKFSSLWDNPITNTMQAISDWSEKAMPNYRTTEEEERPFWENFATTNFWGDTILKNVGFTIGAFYSGGVYNFGVKGLGYLAKAGARKFFNSSINTIKNISKATNYTAATVHAVSSAAAEGSIEALNNSRDWFNLEKAKLDDYYAGALQKAKDNFGEDSVEYQNAAANIANAYKDSLQDLTERKDNMGNIDLLMNIPILAASNIVQFGRFMANGFKTTKKGLNIGGGWGNFVGKTNKKTIAYGAAKGIVSEGSEEFLQKVASDTAGFYEGAQLNNDTIDNFRKAKYDIGAQKEVLDGIGAFAKAFSQNFKDPKSWEEFFVGALFGAVGMPGFRSTRDAQGNRQSPVYLMGGVYNEIQQGLEQKRREQEVVDYMNSRANDPKFRAYYEGVVRNRAYEKIMQESALAGDNKTYKDAEINQLISDLVMFDEAGKLSVLKDQIKLASENLSDEEVDQIIESTSKIITVNDQKQQIKDKIEELKNKRLTLQDDDTIQSLDKEIEQLTQQLNSNDFTDKTVAVFKDDSDNPQDRDYVRQKIKENVKEVKNALEYYEKVKEELREKYGDRFSTEELKSLIWLKARANNAQERMAGIYEKLPTDTRSQGYIQEILNRVNDRIIEIENDANFQDKKSEQYEKLKEEHDEGVKNRKIIQNAVDSISRLNTELGKLDEFDDSYNRKATHLIAGNIDDINKFVNVTSEFLYEGSPELMEETKQDLKDLTGLTKSMAQFESQLIKYLANPNSLRQAHKRADKAIEKDKQNASNNTLINRLNFNGTSTDLLNSIDENMEDIDLAGGLDKLKDSLTDEQKTKLDEALKKKKLKGTITGNMHFDDDTTQQLADKLMDEVMEQVSDFTDPKELRDLAIEKLNAGFVRDNTEIDNTSSDSIDEIAQIEASLLEFLNNDFEKAMQEFGKRDLEQEALKKTEETNGVPEENTEDNIDDDIPVEENDVSQPLNEETPPAPLEENQEEEKVPEDESAPRLTTTETGNRNAQARKNTVRGVQQGINKKEYTMRPQISQYYFYGYDSQTYLDFINKHSEYIPEGVDKEAYKKYIEAVYNYLNDKGAFQYVNSGQLKEGDQLRFTTDPELNKLAGTFVPIIVKVNQDGTTQVVGTFKTQLDFDSKTRYKNDSGKIVTAKKSQKEINPEAYQLFQEIKKRAESDKKEKYITTTVNKMRFGNMNLSDKNNLVSSIVPEHNGRQETPIIAIVDGTGQPSNGTSMDSSFHSGDFNPYSVVMMIKSPTTGQYFPALCVSLDLKSLLKYTPNIENDWYLNNIKQVLKKLDASNTKEISRELRKWVYLPGLTLKLGKFANKQWINAETNEDAKSLNISYYNSKTAKYEYVKIPVQIQNGEVVVSTKKVLEALIKKNPNLTVNVDKSRLNPNTDQEYLLNISKYLLTNVVKGATTTVNEWFTFNPPAIIVDDSKPVIEQKPKRVTGTEFNGYTISDGIVYDQEGNPLSNSEQQEVLRQYRESQNSNKATTQDSQQSGSIDNVMEGLFREGATDETQKEDATNDTPKLEYKTQLLPESNGQNSSQNTNNQSQGTISENDKYLEEIADSQWDEIDDREIKRDLSHRLQKFGNVAEQWNKLDKQSRMNLLKCN